MNTKVSEAANTFRPISQKPWLALTILCVSFFMAVADATSVYSALPSIERTLKFTLLGAEWTVIIYMLMSSGLVLLGGRISDYFGRRKVFIVGVIAFTCSAIPCGLAISGEMLILSRLFQGVSAAIMIPSALAMVMNMFNDEKSKNKAIAIWGAIGGVGATGGLLLGGPITVWLGWEWIFFINIPVGIMVVLFAPILLKESNDRTIAHFDFLGAILITAFLLLFAYTITVFPEYGFFNFQTIILLLICVLIFTVFLYVEKKNKEPLVPFRVFKSSTLVGGNLLILIAGMSVDGMLYTFTFFAQQLLGYSSQQFSLTMTAMTIASVIAAYSSQKIISQYGLRITSVVGVTFIGLSMFLINVLPVDTTIWLMLPILSVFGIGIGSLFVTAQIAALTNVDEIDSGLAAGIVETSFSIGGALGVALSASVAKYFSLNDNHDTLTRIGVDNAFWTVVVFAIIGLFIVLSFFSKGVRK